MPLLDTLQVPTYSLYFKDILANKYEIATLGVDHVKMSEQCSTAIARGGHSVLTDYSVRLFSGEIFRFSYHQQPIGF
jgi:hypothetical protein